jgi:hypothetical protein
MRDAPAFDDRQDDGSLDLEAFVDNVRKRVRKLQEGRLQLPSEVPHTEAHNTWVFNKPSTLVVIPVGDLSQHVLLNLCYMLQNGLVLYDDINQCALPGIELFRDIVDVDHVWPITFVEQWSLSELTVELGASCYAGTLMLQAMGLGGWMFNGVDPFAMLGASGEPQAPGFGFRYDTDTPWPYPNPTGLPGVMEGCCPPHYPDMAAAVEAVCALQVRPRRTVSCRHARALEGQSKSALSRPGSRPTLSGVHCPPGPIPLRHLWQISCNGALDVPHHVPPGTSSRP